MFWYTSILVFYFSHFIRLYLSIYQLLVFSLMHFIFLWIIIHQYYFSFFIPSCNKHSEIYYFMKLLLVQPLITVTTKQIPIYNCLQPKQENDTQYSSFQFFKVFSRAPGRTLLNTSFFLFFPLLVFMFYPEIVSFCFKNGEVVAQCFLESQLWKIGGSLERVVQIQSYIIVSFEQNQKYNMKDKTLKQC